MKQVLIRGGKAVVTDVPAPVVQSRNILVRVEYSCISVGTEIAGIKMSGLPLYKRALKQPENVGRVLEMVREQGLKRTMDRVSGKLAAGNVTGYSAAGAVTQIGEHVTGFSIGDRVACAGAGIANHAEIIDVPVNLAVRLPENVGTDVGSSVTLGAIAMQGVRRAQPTLGENVVVVGLGIIGQLTAQMLAANGCRVIGVDLDENRVRIAKENGLDIGLDARTENYVERVLSSTGGIGADCAIVTAATESNEVISAAMNACRKKGRIVLVGDVGLDLNRADFYKKELDFLISTSYGPGRYDPYYEEGGQDYPLPYVRWTENRNMQAYLELLANRKVRLDSFYQTPCGIDRAGEAYDSLKGEGDKPLMVLLQYPPRPDAILRRIELQLPVAKKADKIRVAIAGASSFVQGMHLPNMVILRKDFELHAVMSRTGANARGVATQYQATYCTTDYEEILKDDQVDLIMITTRHDLHGQMALQALRAGKHAFVEKPLTLKIEELSEIEQFYVENPGGPLLMVGFNRRFAPAIQLIRQILEKRTTPIIANYRMNAGFIPPENWLHGPEGGGRNLGEACHIYDLFNSLCGASKEIAINAYSIDPVSEQWNKNDNFVATIKYADGSVCALTYTALGDKSYPKEGMEVFVDGKVIVMDDYKSVTVHGGRHNGWSDKTVQKGQLQELEALADTLLRGKLWPISLSEQIQATRISHEVERQIFSAA